MYDAAVAGMLCARRYDAITQGWFGGVADRIGDDELSARLRINSRSPTSLPHLWTRRD
jgi:hypothetical protein